MADTHGLQLLLVLLAIAGVAYFVYRFLKKDGDL
jgi:hypothetical protein